MLHRKTSIALANLPRRNRTTSVVAWIADVNAIERGGLIRDTSFVAPTYGSSFIQASSPALRKSSFIWKEDSRLKNSSLLALEASIGNHHLHREKLPFPRKEQEEDDNKLSNEEEKDESEQSTRSCLYQLRLPITGYIILIHLVLDKLSLIGMQAMLSLYLQGRLHLSEDESTIIYHAFGAIGYLVPIAGAIIADNGWGRFKTIVVFSFISLLAYITLPLSAGFFWPSWLFLVILFLLAIGSGGVRACLSTFAADQLSRQVAGEAQDDTNVTKTEDVQMETFFGLIYFSVNLGGFLGQFSLPLLHDEAYCQYLGLSEVTQLRNRTWLSGEISSDTEQHCYSLAFTVACLAYLVGLLIFLLPSAAYKKLAPEGAMVTKFVRCLLHAFHEYCMGRCSSSLKRSAPRGRCRQNEQQQQQIQQKQSGRKTLRPRASSSVISAVASTGIQHSCSSNCLTATHQHRNCPTQAGVFRLASISHLSTPEVQGFSTCLAHNYSILQYATPRYSDEFVDSLRQTLGIASLFLPMPVFWAIYEQQGSRWIFQANEMDGRILVNGAGKSDNNGSSERLVWQIKPEQMLTLNLLTCLVTIPLVNLVVYPVLEHFHLFTRPTSRIIFGYLLAAAAFLAAAILQVSIDEGYQNSLLSVPSSWRTMPNPRSAALETSSQLILINNIPACPIDWKVTCAKPECLSHFRVEGSVAARQIETVRELSSGNATIQIRPKATCHEDTIRFFSPSNIVEKTIPLESKAHTFIEIGLTSSADVLSDFRESRTLSLSSRRSSSSPFPPSALLYESGRSAQLTTNYASSQALGSDLDNAMDYSVEVVLLGKMSKLEKTKLSRFLINNWNPNRPEFAHVEMVPLKAHSKSTKIMPTSIKSPVKTVSDYGIVRNSTIGHNSITGQVASSIHTDDDLQKAAHSIRPGTYNLLGLEGENSSTRLHLGEISLQPASISLITLSTTSTGTVEAKVYVLHEARLVHMLYQVPQIMLLTLSEIFVCIPAMTFAYSESPAGMKTTVQAVNLVTIFIGNCLVILAASVPGRQTDRVQEFLLFAGLAIACALVTWLLVRRYRANQQRRAEREEFIRLLHLKAAEEAAASALAASIPEDQGQHKRGKAVQEENEGEQLGHQLVENEHASLLRPSSQAPQIAEVVWKEKSKADPSETGRIGIAEVISVCREEPVKRTFDHKKSSQVSQASGGSPLLLQTQRSFIILGRSEQGHPSRPGRADSLLAEARKFSYTSGLHQSVWPSCQIISPSKKLSHSAGSPCFSGTTSATSAALASGLATVGVVTSNSNRRRSRGTSLSVWSPHIARMEPDAGGALARYDSFYSVGEQSVGWRVGELAYAEPGFGLDIRSLAEKHLCLEQERS